MFCLNVLSNIMNCVARFGTAVYCSLYYKVVGFEIIGQIFIAQLAVCTHWMMNPKLQKITPCLTIV